MFPTSSESVTQSRGANFRTAPSRAVVTSRPFAGLVEAVRESRTELDATVMRMRELCAALSRGLAPAAPGPEAIIEEFEFHLVSCFVAEEVEEFIGSLATSQPRLIRRVERLQVEHGEMAGALDCLLELARRGPAGPEFGVLLTRFLDWLDAHEHAENAVMQELLLLDEGGSD